MSQAQKEKCTHEGCRCEVASGRDYCSERCEQAAKGPGNVPAGVQQRCDCGHAGCQ
jgi:hypothetical protein